MPNPAFKNSLKKIILIIVFILGANPVFSAQDTAAAATSNYGYLENNDTPAVKKGRRPGPREGGSEDTPVRKGKSGIMQEQARLYRKQGLQLQSIGDLESAMAFYQKAIELDPAYAIAYNDLGIIYEAQGWPDRAEESYIKAINIDPSYLSPYANLAMLYESQRKLDQAAFFWQKRAEFGDPGDPWTEKARNRFEDILLVLGKKPDTSSREQEILELMQDVSANLSSLKKEKEPPFKKIQKDNQNASKDYINKAKQSYQKGDYYTALRQAIEAKQLDPSNTDIDMFIEELQRKLLSR
ncbi:MAG: tetratricopeptide repeat protein [Candidatus Omnitrophica bacterium]|nr:tetratricopeptide repeat protein [Candidatus Omnitrophota bacterium]